MAGGLNKEEGCIEALKSLSKEEILEVLSHGLCQHCDSAVQNRIQSLPKSKLEGRSISNNGDTASPLDSPVVVESKRHQNSLIKPGWGPKSTPEPVFSRRQNGFNSNLSPASVNISQSLSKSTELDASQNKGPSRAALMTDIEFSEEEDHIRCKQVVRKKDFNFSENINGKSINVLKGLELHTKVFDSKEQKMIVESVFNLQRMGQNGQLRGRTYSEPRKWMRGKGRATIQFGCCYNYAVDKDGNPPGIIRDEEVDPLPPLFKEMIKRMVRWRILPPTCVPDSCIVNIYDEGDCIPPHIDHHDFLRPFCTVSFLSECNILFGANLKVVAPGEFSGPVSIPLPAGSVFILNGNGADVAKHCVPAVPSKRISITFRKMDHSKCPYTHIPDLKLVGIKPLPTSTKSSIHQEAEKIESRNRNDEQVSTKKEDKFGLREESEFPSLGSLGIGNRQTRKRNYF